MIKNISDLQISDLQDEIEIWMKWNFGINPGYDGQLSHEPAYLPLLSIVEEVSEIIISLDIDHPKDLKDAFGDSMISCIGYCVANEWDAEDLWNIKIKTTDDRFRGDNKDNLVVILGSLCRAQLKKDQGIRGDFEQFNKKGKIALRKLFSWLEFTYIQYFGYRQSLLETTNKVWLSVRKRNFRSDPEHGEIKPLDWKD